MIDLKFVDELTHRLSNAFPEGVQKAGKDIEAHIHSILTAAFERMDLVTREQFKAQCAILERTREKLEALESQLAELADRTD